MEQQYVLYDRSSYMGVIILTAEPVSVWIFRRPRTKEMQFRK